MSFMQLQTRSGAWVVFDSREGGHCLWLRDVFSNDVAGAFERISPLTPGQIAEMASVLDSMGYRGIALDSIEIKFGFCARYSAPGYLDCTEWVGPYASAYDADKQARALYGNDDSNACDAAEGK